MYFLVRSGRSSQGFGLVTDHPDQSTPCPVPRQSHTLVDGQRTSKNSSDHPFLTPLQGAKAQQKRDRNAAQNPQKGSKSQLKVNEASKSIICQTCKQPFVSIFSPQGANNSR